MTAEILRIHPDEPEPDRIQYVATCIRNGKVVGMPTDTFYGLAVDPVNLRAVESIYEIKSRLKQKPLSLLISGLAQAYQLARECGICFDLLAERFWPGPLTVIVKASSRLPLRSTANTGQRGAAGAGCGDSARGGGGAGDADYGDGGESGRAAGVYYANCVRDQIGDRIPLIVDGGPTGRSVPTTIVDLSGPEGSVADSAGRRDTDARDRTRTPGAMIAP